MFSVISLGAGVQSSTLAMMVAKGVLQRTRSACRYCPFRSNNEWLDLIESEPAEFTKAVRFERAIQALQDVDKRLNGQIFLHSSCVPLDQIDFSKCKNESMFPSDCTGMCGS